MWVLKSDRHYTNGKTAVLYFKCMMLGFHECASSPETAMQFKTKKEAIAYRNTHGFDRSWEAVRAEA